ncbi:MAG: hypothetical protein GY936_10085 [Ignavibacteriae bacterium]|nr:hypothetical protein [Ignavibacteriota bacterium]
MKWSLLEYNSFTGKHNMELDLQLVNSCKSGEAYLRFYGWEPYCISIGANQSVSEINNIRILQDNIDIVKRPTGGRAVFHAEELTYSVVISNYENFSGKILYNQISQAIVHGLKLFNSRLDEVKLETVQPNFSDELNKSSGALCFASTAKSEIKFNGKKLVGSAQRKIGDTILQHGSILIGNFHNNLVNYLNVEKSEFESLHNELETNTTELETILNEKIILVKLQESIIKGFESTFNILFSKELQPTL